jgi:hypothetical protein
MVFAYDEIIDSLSPSRRYLTQILGQNFPGMMVSSENELILENGSATLFINTRDGYGQQGILITINSPLVHRIPMSQELVRWVAVEGRSHDIGSVYLVPSGEGETCEIWLGHSLVGNELDGHGILAMVYQLLVLADHLDDLIRERFGGIRFAEKDLGKAQP